MLYNGKRRKIDPLRVNTYNKFLTTLDKQTTCKKDDTSFTKEIDKIIEKINQNYDEHHHSSIHFTEYSLFNGSWNNPNDYNDIMSQRRKRPNVKPLDIELANSVTEKKELTRVIVEAEISNISDILKLVETYPLDPSIQYNINMKALHDMKEPLQELEKMIGMQGLKSNIVDQILYFVQELHKNNNVDGTGGDFMHTVIYGPPGTGKTEIAKIMGKIYSKIGVLSKGTFKKVTRSDLIAGYLGQTSIKTSDVIKEALGGVLFIDEAYALGNPEKKDSFAKECIDTLCEALSDYKDNLMVIIAGYEKELKDCFFVFNQGLESRFTWRFKTDEYSAEDLYHIFLKMVAEIGWSVDDNNSINVEWFKNNKDYLKFYGRDVETILAKTKIAHSRRVFCKTEDEKRRINLQDLESGFAMYLKNEEVKNRKDDMENKKYLYNTLYF